MKVCWFHLMPYPHLPDDFKDKYRSVWVDVPSGSIVEIWSYASLHATMGAGDTELYFVDDSAAVNGLAFSPQGVVYESRGGAE